MARTTFTDGISRILASWLNKVDATVVDGLGEQDTPAGVLGFINGVSQDEYTLHVGNTADPHNVQDYLLGGYTIQVVSALPTPIDSGVIYYVI